VGVDARVLHIVWTTVRERQMLCIGTGVLHAVIILNIWISTQKSSYTDWNTECHGWMVSTGFFLGGPRTKSLSREWLPWLKFFKGKCLKIGHNHFHGLPKAFSLPPIWCDIACAVEKTSNMYIKTWVCCQFLWI
jgi:hypothetical protein